MILKMTNGDEELSTINTIIAVGYTHSFGISVLLGDSKISLTGTSILILSDCLLNSLNCKSIINLHRQGTVAANSRRDNLLKYLALKEFLEILVPLNYCLSFILAYWGPNAEIIGNVKLDIWHFKKVESLSDKLSNIAIFLVIDATRGLTFSFIIWYLCNLELYKGYCEIIRIYGLFIFLYGSVVTNGVNDYHPDLITRHRLVKYIRLLT